MIDSVGHAFPRFIRGIFVVHCDTPWAWLEMMNGHESFTSRFRFHLRSSFGRCGPRSCRLPCRFACAVCPLYGPQCACSSTSTLASFAWFLSSGLEALPRLADVFSCSSFCYHPLSGLSLLARLVVWVGIFLLFSEEDLVHDVQGICSGADCQDERY